MSSKDKPAYKPNEHFMNQYTATYLDGELLAARMKFPNQDQTQLVNALIEEFLEMMRAINDNEGIERVRTEALQVACVAVRIYEECDK